MKARLHRRTTRRHVTCRTAVAAFVLVATIAPPTFVMGQAAAAEGTATPSGRQSLADTRFAWPDREHVVRVLTLRDYNTRVVLLGTTLLGVSAGVVGSFMLLRKRSLVGDVVSHASLPGVAVAFIVLESVRPGSGRSLEALLLGAALAGAAGVACMLAIRRWTRIKEDAAMAIVLSIFFGVGVALFTVIQDMPTGNVAGLHHFIYGKAASMIYDDVVLIAEAAGVVLLASCLLFKEFSLLCFDEEFGAAQGWPMLGLDLALMGLVVGVTVIGLQSVGLLLAAALLIVPAAAARFWSDNLATMIFASAGLGGASAFLGVVASALFPRFAAGAVIVLVGAAFFAISLLFGVRRGVLQRLLVHWKLQRRTGRHDLLRAFYECLEPALSGDSGDLAQQMEKQTVAFDQLVANRTWQPARVRRLLRPAIRRGSVVAQQRDRFRLTPKGVVAAQRVVRNHRLWELYLITHADVALTHVDRDADQIEHVLDPALIEELQAELQHRSSTLVPPSPHPIEAEAPAAS